MSKNINDDFQKLLNENSYYATIPFPKAGPERHSDLNKTVDAINAHLLIISGSPTVNPYAFLNKIQKCLLENGFQYDAIVPGAFVDDIGSVEIPLSLYGGRTGFLNQGSSEVSSDDGISHLIGTGLNLRLTWVKVRGLYTFDAEIVPVASIQIPNMSESYIHNGVDHSLEVEHLKKKLNGIWSNKMTVHQELVKNGYKNTGEDEYKHTIPVMPNVKIVKHGTDGRVKVKFHENVNESALNLSNPDPKDYLKSMGFEKKLKPIGFKSGNETFEHTSHGSVTISKEGTWHHHTTLKNPKDIFKLHKSGEGFDDLHKHFKNLKESLDKFTKESYMNESTHEDFKDHTKNPYHKILINHGFSHISTEYKPDNNDPALKNWTRKNDSTEHIYSKDQNHIKIQQYHSSPPGEKPTNWTHYKRVKFGSGIEAFGDTKPKLEKHLNSLN